MRSSTLLLERRAFLAGFGALAATLAICPSPMIARAAARDTIYQGVWDADQATNGIPAIARDQAGDATRGFVRVDEHGGRDPKHRLFAEVHIPAHKRRPLRGRAVPQPGRPERSHLLPTFSGPRVSRAVSALSRTAAGL
jgi:hypothetical protein